MKGASTQCANSSLPVARGFEMQRNFAGNDGFASGKEGFELFRYADMAFGSPCCSLPM